MPIRLMESRLEELEKKLTQSFKDELDEKLGSSATDLAGRLDALEKDFESKQDGV